MRTRARPGMRGYGRPLSAFAGGGSAAAWTPASLTGLAAWYTAGPTWCFTDAGATVPAGDGDPVRVWKDRSGNLLTVSQGTLGARPTLTASGGGWYLAFDGVNDVLSGTLTLTQEFWVGMAAKTGPALAQRLFDSTSRALFGTTPTNYELYAGSSDLTTGTADTVARAYLARFNGASSLLAVDGVTQVSGNPGAAGTGGTAFLGNDNAGGAFMTGRVAGLVASSGTMTAGDQASLTAYLQSLNT